MTKASSNLNDQYQAEVAASLRALTDLTIRLDERFKGIEEKIRRAEDMISAADRLSGEQEEKLRNMLHATSTELKLLRMEVETLCRDATEVEARVTRIEMLEQRIFSLEEDRGRNQSRWGRVVHIAVEVGILVAAGYVALKLGTGIVP